MIINTVMRPKWLRKISPSPSYLEGKLVIDPHEYKNVIEMVRLKTTGLSFRAIARAMNGKKVTTRLGKTWTHEIIKRICDREKFKVEIS
ncbi:MAG: recombinase family protein [Bdellovibrionales bacterium]|nr:recombinase family protein [Bdellovibrionales bacterium]